MQSRFPPGAFKRWDESSDFDFYADARLVTHIDDYAIAAVGETYRRFLRPGGEYLDLMSSWVSHFPAGFEIGRLVGHGMNEIELRANKALAEHFLQDLNDDPTLPFDDNRFDGVTICVSVQYLTEPVAVFSEIGRVLKPGAPLIVTFSNRFFQTKAVSIWLAFNDLQHGQLVRRYAQEAGYFDEAEVHDMSPRTTFFGVPDDDATRSKVASGAIYTDPLYAVVARKRSDQA